MASGPPSAESCPLLYLWPSLPGQRSRSRGTGPTSTWRAQLTIIFLHFPCDSEVQPQLETTGLRGETTSLLLTQSRI